MKSEIAPWNFECQVEYPLPIVNLYRRVLLHEVGCFKLDIVRYECDDVFIIREFIEQRIRQIPVNQSMQENTFKINIKNALD